MKLKVMREVEARFVRVQAAVRYEEEDMPNDAPMRKGGMWDALIDIEKKKVVAWPEGKELIFDMKVCDEGTYTLFDANMEEIAKINGYVPNKLLPGEYGDYLDLNINGEGVITNWLPRASLENFAPELD